MNGSWEHHSKQNKSDSIRQKQRFHYIGNIKQKAAHKQAKLTDTNNSMVVTRGKEGRENEESKEGQMYGDERLDFGW